MSTIQDVARHAGVSISTVSRVINKTANVDPATEQRVQVAVATLGYRPNLLARSFRRKETQTIGLLVPDNSNPFFAEIARVIEDMGFAEGYSVILCNSDLSQVKQAAYVDVLLAKRVDGLILTSTGLISSTDGLDMMERILAAGVPCVVVDRDLEGSPIDQVLVDNIQGGYMAGEYLTSLGHRQIACLVGPHELTPSAGRSAGFQQALADAGVALSPDAIVRGNGRFDGGELAARTLLDSGVPFTAMFTFNDAMAIGAIGTLRRAGIGVPEEVSVIGFDNTPLANAMFPTLTTIAQPIVEMGRRSVRLLLDRIADRDAPISRVVLPTTLVKRESCGMLTNIVKATVSPGPIWASG
jgi:LacI family transcriptional regulator